MLQSQNELINRSELEISRSNGLIERKQTQIDQINKKIEQQMSKQGVWWEHNSYITYWFTLHNTTLTTIVYTTRVKI